MKKILKLEKHHLERLARKLVGAANNHPIQWEKGNNFPYKTGREHWFRWRGRFKSYPGSYQPSTLVVHIGENWGKNFVNPPKGMVYSFDGGLGLCVVRLSDKMDYHPTEGDFKSKNFATRVRQKMAENYLLRLKSNRQKKEQQKLNKIFEENIKNTYVLLEDSRRAGNCVSGSLEFAKRRLNIEPDQILAAPFLVKVPAEKLINTNDERAKRAVWEAFRRETLVCI